MQNNDTPTYDELSALCAQMAAALGVSWNALNYYATTPCARDDLAAPAEILAALTAYRTLSPDPQWQISDEVERAAFEAWGKENGMDMHRHPLHYLFLAQETHAARQAWKAGVRYCINRARGEG